MGFAPGLNIFLAPIAACPGYGEIAEPHPAGTAGSRRPSCFRFSCALCIRHIREIKEGKTGAEGDTTHVWQWGMRHPGASAGSWWEMGSCWHPVKSQLLKQPQLRKENDSNLQHCTLRLCLENMRAVNEESTLVRLPSEAEQLGKKSGKLGVPPVCCETKPSCGSVSGCQPGYA